MSVRQYVLPVLATGVGAAVVVAGVASAQGGAPAAAPHDHQAGAHNHQAAAHNHAAAGSAGTAVQRGDSGYETSSRASATYLAAGMVGRNEVGAGDPDGRAMGVVRIKGDQVSYVVRWQGIAAPRAFHIHSGAAGTNGPVRVDFALSELPAGIQAITGSVKVTDQVLLDAIEANPSNWYLNLHTGEFPAGAVRGQLRTLPKAVDLAGVLHGTLTANLSAHANGAQEVPATDPDGRAEWLLRASDDKVRYSAVWSGIGAPTNGHIHRGAEGVNGPVVIDFFAAPNGLPASVTGVAGEVPADASVVKQLAANPANWYTNLHNAEFKAGAVRGQVMVNRHGQPRAVQAAVVGASQIYSCAKQADGSFGYGQFGVAAVLREGILHSFAKPVAGPPQWIAPDGTAVTATVLSRSDNGAGNIPELVLAAKQTGGRSGILAATRLILRLNTVGGVAPTGPCDPETQAVATVPYQADYLFLG